MLLFHIPKLRTVSVLKRILITILIVLSVMTIFGNPKDLIKNANYDKLKTLIDIRIEKERYKVTPIDKERLEAILPYIVYLSNSYSIDPVIFITIIEQESGYRWITGDSGKAAGFVQLHLSTAWYCMDKFKNELIDMGLTNTEIKSIKDLEMSVIRTSVLGFYWFILKLKETGSYRKAIGLYNGVDNESYINNFVEKYMQLHEIYFNLKGYSA